MTDDTLTVSTATPSAAPAAAAPAATAPKPQAHFETDTQRNSAPMNVGKWSPQQAAAHAELQTLRAEMMNPEGKSGVNSARVKFREISDFLYAGGPLPAHMRPAAAQPDPTSPATDANGFTQSDFSSVYEPATQPTDYTLQHGAKLPTGFTDDPAFAQETVGDLQQMMFDLKMPAKAGSDVIERILHHSGQAADDAHGGVSTFISPNSDFANELRTEADRLLQPIGGFDKAVAGVETYMRSVLTPQQYNDVIGLLRAPDGSVSTMAYDPTIIYRVLSVAKARGIIKAD